MHRYYQTTPKECAALEEIKPQASELFSSGACHQWLAIIPQALSISG